jgi:Arc/MetJ-type ribon-helix-helix transcriptional regulator
MNVELTPDQRAFVQKAIESGRFEREEEAVKEALALWNGASAAGSKSLP